MNARHFYKIAMVYKNNQISYSKEYFSFTQIVRPVASINYTYIEYSI
jgi:hypothetical protein